MKTQLLKCYPFRNLYTLFWRNRITPKQFDAIPFAPHELVPFLRHPSSEVQERAGARLAEYGWEGMEELWDAIRETHGEVRETYIWVFKQYADDSICARLFQRIDRRFSFHEKIDVRGNFILFLGIYNIVLWLLFPAVKPFAVYSASTLIGIAMVYASRRMKAQFPTEALLALQDKRFLGAIVFTLSPKRIDK